MNKLTPGLLLAAMNKALIDEGYNAYIDTAGLAERVVEILEELEKENERISEK